MFDIDPMELEKAVDDIMDRMTDYEGKTLHNYVRERIEDLFDSICHE